MKPMAKNTKHKKAESVAETLCSFSGFLCDIVISVYMIVILMVLPLYNKGYARIGTEKETFFLKTMTYGAKTLLPVFLLWLLFRLVTAVQKKELPKFTEWPAGLWKNLSVTDRFAVFYGIAVLVSYLFTDYREEALWGTASWRMGITMTWVGAILGGRTRPLLSPCTMIRAPIMRVVMPQEVWCTYFRVLSLSVY